MTEQAGGVTSLRDQHGPFFGDYGGRYMPESLIAAIDELTEALEQLDAAVIVSTHDRGLLGDLAEWPAVELAGA